MKLPKPDEHGNYWLGDRQYDPAIFPSKRLVGDNDDEKEVVTVAATFYATLGRERGFLMNGYKLSKFATPQEALQAIERAR